MISGPQSNHSNRAARVARRAGTSLIECLVYIFMAGAIGVLGFEILNRLLRLDGSERRAQSELLFLERLERQWRDDSHHAESFLLSESEAGKPDSAVTLTVGAQSVRYAAGPEGIVTRTAEERGERRATERWELDADVIFRASLDQRLLSLELTPRPVVRENPSLRATSVPGGAQSRGRIILDAAVGTDRPKTLREEAKP